MNCAASLQGQACVLVNGAQTCGCSGPADHDDCPTMTACRDMQCTSACDGQHPCHDGCCSAATNGECVAACDAGATCVVNACQ